MAQNKNNIYLASVILFMLIFPVTSIFIDRFTCHAELRWVLVGKWFVFWCVGVRLFIGGIRQVTKPAFTAKEIFNIQGEESFVVIRELGFANISLGIIGMLSLFYPPWCEITAIAGCLFYGLAGIQHIVKKPASSNEMMALISDILIALLLALYLVFTIIQM